MRTGSLAGIGIRSFIEGPVISDSEHPISRPREGGSRELIGLALPLIVSQSFMTVQIFVDTMLLSWHNPDEMAASFPAVMWFWLGFGFLQVTAGYTSTFVAQYTGAGRPHRVGPAVWQGLYFAVGSGLLFLVMVPAAPFLISLGGHPEAIQPLEVDYLQTLSFAALPMLILSAVNGFYSGQGRTWTVLGIESVGTAVNVGFAMLLIFGRAGFPEMGIRGAGWSTVIGSWASAIFGLMLFLNRSNRLRFNTLAGRQWDRDLFRRLMWFGGPAGLQLFLDVLVFLMFTMLVGRLGEAELGATTLAVRLNMVAFLPMMGLGQAICILVGQRLGADRPDLAEKSTYTGVMWVSCYMALVASIYLLFPHTLVSIFETDVAPEKFAAIALIVPNLLICVAIYSLVDGANVSFAFALRGAGDTKFVTAATFLLAWPVMVLPTWYIVSRGMSLYWAWGFVTAHIFVMAICFWLRFRSGVWKTMRVIEPGLPEADPLADEELAKSPAV